MRAQLRFIFGALVILLAVLAPVLGGCARSGDGMEGEPTISIEHRVSGPILFTRDRQTRAALYTVSLEGHVSRLTGPYVYRAASAAWSPDGRRVAVDVPSGTVVSGEGEPRIVGVPLGDPSWSPNGQRVVGREPDSGAIKIWELRRGTDTYVYEPVGRGELPAFDPDWSLSEDLLVLVLSSYAGEQAQLWLWRPPPPYRNPSAWDAPRFSTKGLHDLGDPDWSPDGREIAFHARPLAQSEAAPSSIYVARRGEARPRLIARNAVQPTWSPDGRKIAFVRFVSGRNSEIFVMNADGTSQRRLTYHPARDHSPDWRPSP